MNRASPGPRAGLSRLRTLSLLAPALGGCMVGPDYHRPPAVISQRFKEMPPPPGWAYADPHYAELPKGAWWQIYHDPVLDRLESRIDVSNQTIKSDEAAFRQARALVDEARANLFPTASITPGVTRQGNGSGGAGTFTTVGGTGAAGTTGIGTGAVGGGSREYDITNYSLSGTVDWELDVWGRIRRQVESQVAAAQVAEATLDAARLSEQTTLATDYFELRYQDSLRTLLQQSVDAYRRSAQITRNSYQAGVSAPTDLLQAETLIAQTQAQLVAVDELRAQYEHAIAVLTGAPPADLDLSYGALTNVIPPVPVAVPSTLLQRRPDIAETERSMEEEDALIGVAIAAFFPTISLSATASYVGDPLRSLIQVANRSWSLAATAAETLFEGGERTAAVRAARAAYDQSVANYRETVLTAFQGVEDQLSNLRILAEQADAQKLAVDLSNETVRVSLNQYVAGTAIYTTVLTNQVTALGNAETALGIQEDRLVASVTLVGNLGGGWDTSRLIGKDALQVDDPLLPSFIQPNRN